MFFFLLSLFRLNDGLLRVHWRQVLVTVLLRAWCFILYLTFPNSVAYKKDPALIQAVLDVSHPTKPASLPHLVSFFCLPQAASRLSAGAVWTDTGGHYAADVRTPLLCMRLYVLWVHALMHTGG